MVFQKGQLFSAVLWTCLIIYIVILIKFIKVIQKLNISFTDIYIPSNKNWFLSKKNTHLPRKVVLSEDLKTSTTVLPQPQITSELYQLMPSQKSSLEILEEEILTSIFQNLNFSQASFVWDSHILTIFHTKTFIASFLPWDHVSKELQSKLLFYQHGGQDLPFCQSYYSIHWRRWCFSSTNHSCFDHLQVFICNQKLFILS